MILINRFIKFIKTIGEFMSVNRKDLALGQHVFDEKFNVYMITDFNNSYIKITKIAPRKPEEEYRSYSINKSQLTKVAENIFEVVL